MTNLLIKGIFVKVIMKYRKMGSLGWEVSALGFGAMRLPVNQVKDEKTQEQKYNIDED